MRVVAVALGFAALLPLTASAQDPPAAPVSKDPPASQAAPTVDPAKLPVDLGRIRLQLAHKPPAKGSGLRIQEIVEVVAIAPPIQLWNPETAKLATGPVPWGAPTHREFIDLHTPQEFKRYPMDINALMQWLMEKLGDKDGTKE
jgi:hypothetical protein